MSKKRQFLEKYFLSYVDKSRSQINDESQVPPTVREIEELISHLQDAGVDPIIVGSVAIFKHLSSVNKDMQEDSHKHTKELDVFISNIEVDSYRYTKDLDLFISKQIPKPPAYWKRDQASIGVISWISPSGGYVDFLIAGQTFPEGSTNPKKIGKDPESVQMECPVADVLSLFLMKLNSFREKDMLDLLTLARKLGIPREMSNVVLNRTQSENLSLLTLWLANEK